MALILDVRDSAPAGPNSRPTLGGGTGLREKSRSAQHRSQQMRLKIGQAGWSPGGVGCDRMVHARQAQRQDHLRQSRRTHQ
jgi:hypothetical protein